MTEVALPSDRMPEAEVALRLAFHLLGQPGSQRVAHVAIDGAQVRVGGRAVFPIAGFLAGHGWTQVGQRGRNPWQGEYERGPSRLVIASRPGVGDVVVRIGEKRVVAECKGGLLVKKRGSREYPALREAIGQLVTAEYVTDQDVLVAAVPLTPAFRELAAAWRSRPLVRRTGIQIVLVGRDGRVEGMS